MRIVRQRIRHHRHGEGLVIKRGVVLDTYVVQFDRDMKGLSRTVRKSELKVKTP